MMPQIFSCASSLFQINGYHSDKKFTEIAVSNICTFAALLSLYRMGIGLNLLKL